MKKIKLFLLFFVACSFFKNSIAQTQLPTNANINIVTANAGVVNLGATLDLSVSVANTGSNPIQRNRVRPSISIPIAIATALANGLQTGLPVGWVITVNNGATITICNGTDVIPAGETRTAIIKIQGTATGGPFTIGGTLQFGPGTTVCTGLGTLNGDGPADNITSTAVTVTNVLPLTLTDFNATLKDCQPVLHWSTASEINTDRFEIERSNTSGNDWKMAGNIAASGNSSSKINYNFTDKDLNASSEKVLYRLKMLDKDGSFTYSKILPVLVNCKTATVLVYPNPVQNGKLFVTLAGTVGYAEANLMSVSGQVIITKKIVNGSNDINVSNIADGIYMLRIKDTNGFDKNIKVSVGR